MTTIRDINEYLATIPHDTMNDYTPPAIYVDYDGGNYGDAKNLVIIDVSTWDADDEQVWHDMSDSERQGYALDIVAANEQTATPSEYMREIGR